MTFTHRIPAESLRGLDVHEGDTLHVMALLSSAYVVQVTRAGTEQPTRGKASDWLRTAKGSVHLAETESADVVRMDYYKTKYGLSQ